MKNIAVIDYGMGNLRSVLKALEFAGANAFISDDPQKISGSSAIVFPGVGSFGPASDNIKKQELEGIILDSIFKGKHFLGLCLGFQLLFDISYEEGRHKGLGVIKGEVKKFEPKEKLKIPHMGWNSVEIKDPGKIMFKGIEDNSYFYFVHSYYGLPEDKNVFSGSSFYGIDFCSAIVKDNVWGCQFHPEKSSENGLKLLKNFVQEVEKC